MRIDFMKILFRLPICCFLFFLAANMTGCGGSAPDQKPAVSKVPDKSEEKPEASKPVATQKESVTAPEKIEAEKPAEKPEASKTVGAKKESAANPKSEKPIIEPESDAGVVAKEEASEPPSEEQLKEAAKALTEAAKDEVVKKNAPRPKVVQSGKLPVVELTVKKHKWVDYKTGMSGDEQGVTFIVYSKHQQNCSIVRDETTGFEAVFRYRSKSDYVGKDSVELEYIDHQPGSGPDDPGTTTKSRQVINITVEK